MKTRKTILKFYIVCSYHKQIKSQTSVHFTTGKEESSLSGFTHDPLCSKVANNSFHIKLQPVADNIFHCMYAVIFSDTVEGLQSSLTYLEMFCNKWDLTVNIDKTKIVVLRKGGGGGGGGGGHIN